MRGYYTSLESCASASNSQSPCSASAMNLDEFSKHLAGYRSHGVESQDERLHDECIRLLSRIEGLLEEMGTSVSGKQRYDSLESGKEMLVEIFDFMASHFGSASVAAELPRVCELRDMVGDVQELIRPSVLTRLFGAKNNSEELRHLAYRQVGDEFSQVYRTLLAIVDGNFSSQEKSKEWSTSCRAFLDDFRRRW